jgi:hypothetical protein
MADSPSAHASASEIADAAEQLTRAGRPVSLVRVILAPDDETCFYLFEAESTDVVLDCVTHTGRSVLRVLPALSVWERPSFNGRPRGRSAPGRAAESRPKGGPPPRP